MITAATQTTGAPVALGFVLIALGVVLYFVPSIVALARHQRTGPVAVINFFLGWTLVGWVVALAMACSAKPKAQPAGYY